MRLVTIALALLSAPLWQAPEKSPALRKPNPFAPSLPELTDAEEEKLDQTINRFIAADTGKLQGAEARDAVADFKKVKPEAIPALIRGLNRAARIDHSCP